LGAWGLLSIDWRGEVELEGKTAIVTGAGSGLGKTYAEALANEGARVVIGDIDPSRASCSANDIVATGGTAIGIQADVGHSEDIREMVELAATEFGGVDILVNNAGLLRERWNLCSELSNEEWATIMSVNVIGAVACARECRPHMRERGGGVIVNQSSMGAYSALTSAYSISKLALSGVTVALAHEFSEDGIRVNGIAPGMMTGRLPEELIRTIVSQQLIKRRGTAEDLVDVLLLLCSERSSFITGQTIHVDGGVDPRP